MCVVYGVPHIMNVASYLINSFINCPKSKNKAHHQADAQSTQSPQNTMKCDQMECMFGYWIISRIHTVQPGFLTPLIRQRSVIEFLSLSKNNSQLISAIDQSESIIQPSCVMNQDITQRHW